MGLSRTVSEINGGFGRKLQILPNLVYLAPREGVLLDFFSKKKLKKLKTKKLAHAPAYQTVETV